MRTVNWDLQGIPANSLPLSVVILFIGKFKDFNFCATDSAKTFLRFSLHYREQCSFFSAKNRIHLKMTELFTRLNIFRTKFNASSEMSMITLRFVGTNFFCSRYNYRWLSNTKIFPIVNEPLQSTNYFLSSIPSVHSVHFRREVLAIFCDKRFSSYLS